MQSKGETSERTCSADAWPWLPASSRWRTLTAHLRHCDGSSSSLMPGLCPLCARQGWEWKECQDRYKSYSMDLEMRACPRASTSCPLEQPHTLLCLHCGKCPQLQSYPRAHRGWHEGQRPSLLCRENKTSPNSSTPQRSLRYKQTEQTLARGNIII